MFDPIALIWLTLWTSIGSYGIYLLYTNDQRASDFYVYGKSLDLKKKRSFFWKIFLLPKRYFAHFYQLALLIFLASFAIIIIYYTPSQLNKQLIEILDKLKGLTNVKKYEFRVEEAKTITTVTSLLFTIILMIVQCSRRLYESLFVSVYSNNSKINIIHYLFGHAFYVMAAISTICPILISQTSTKFTFTNLIDNLVTKQRAIAFVLFIYASHHQHKCHIILGNLRKDKTGQIISEKHYVPSSSLFEFVSCPHFLTEIIIYFCILVAQDFSNYYWNLIFLLVLSTQIINAITEHRWYKKNYRDYPKERKAIIPKLL